MYRDPLAGPIRNSKRSYEQKIAFNIKHDSKSLYAYFRSKQKVQDKVGPLESSDGNNNRGILNGRKPK